MSETRAPIYLDHAATTPVAPEVAAAMAQCLAGLPGNASATHAAGRSARERVERARAQVAALVNAESPAAIVFTSGATEADNLAVLGAARANAARGRHLVTVRTEHRAVLDACARLEREGHSVTYLTPGADGRVAPDAVAAALGPATTLVAVMLVNNETGVVQDVAAIGRLCRERGVLFHVDAAQAAGRVPIDVAAMHVDLMALSAHKCHGPAGVGALYVRREPRPTLQPLQYGGGQEGGLRSGTLPVHQIVGMGVAYVLAAERLVREAPRLAALREHLWRAFAPLGGVLRNGGPAHAAPHILNVSFADVDGEALLAALPDLCVASGAACSSASREPSYVLRALGRADPLAQASLRFGLGATTTADDVERAADRIRTEVDRLRAGAPSGPLRAAPGWVVGEAREPLTATHVRCHLRGTAGRIDAARVEVRGCPDTLAAAAWLAERLPGRDPAALALDAMALAGEIHAAPEKLSRIFTIEDAVHAAALQLRGGGP